MSQKNIEFKSHKAKSYDDKKITSSQHSKIKKNMADQLRREIYTLLPKQDKADTGAWQSYEIYEKWKAIGNEAEADFYYRSYRMWSDELHRLGEQIIFKLKAVKVYESTKKMEESKIINKIINMKKQQYMKYGPSDEED